MIWYGLHRPAVQIWEKNIESSVLLDFVFSRCSRYHLVYFYEVYETGSETSITKENNNMISGDITRKIHSVGTISWPFLFGSPIFHPLILKIPCTVLDLGKSISEYCEKQPWRYEGIFFEKYSFWISSKYIYTYFLGVSTEASFLLFVSVTCSRTFSTEREDAASIIWYIITMRIDLVQILSCKLLDVQRPVRHAALYDHCPASTR